jgi:hypothetical protein
MAHPIDDDMIIVAAVSSPPNKAIAGPAALMPRNCIRLKAVTVNRPNGMAEQNWKNEHMSTSCG